MRAQDLLEPYPSIDVSADAAEAARMIGAEHRIAVVVLKHGKPLTVLAASQVMRVIIPGYLQDDPSLAHLYDEKAADECAARFEERTVGDLVPPKEKRFDVPLIQGKATVLECAALMAKLHVPLLIVVDGDGQMQGVVTASKILERITPTAS